jgi:transposase-like protein
VPALTWINHQTAELTDFILMTSRRDLLVRPCPLCGIAMQASKSRESVADFDTFRCHSCQTTITEQTPSLPGDDKSG